MEKKLLLKVKELQSDGRFVGFNEVKVTAGTYGALLSFYLSPEQDKIPLIDDTLEITIRTPNNDN